MYLLHIREALVFGMKCERYGEQVYSVLTDMFGLVSGHVLQDFERLSTT